MNTDQQSRIHARHSHLVTLALVAVVLLMPGCGKKAPDLPNVILVSIDTLRPDHLGCYGYERSTSPTIDSLATRGVLFLNAEAQSPWTLPSHVTLFSSTFPFTHGVVDDNSRIPADLPMMAEILKGHGYRTAGVVSSFYVGRMFGFERGFDYFEDFASDRYQQVFSGSKIMAETVVDRGIQWMRNSGRPFFLFLHFYDAHVNYIVPEPYRSLFEKSYAGGEILYNSYEHYQTQPLTAPQRRHVLAQYDAAIAYVDAQIARVLDAIRDSGIADNTILVITSDHGEEFFERGSWGHAHTLYREVLAVPLIVVDPRLPSSGAEIREAARVIDIMPTVLEGLGLPAVEGTQGRSLWPFVSREPAGERDPLLFSESSRYNLNLVSLSQGTVKAIADFKNHARELFDLSTDPQEELNIAPEDTSLARALVDEMMGISAHLIPGRLVLRWVAEPGDHTYVAKIRSPGTFVEVDYAGSREAVVDIAPDRGSLRMTSAQSGELRLAVVPVDASVILDLAIDGGPPAGKLVVGGSALRPDEMPLTFPGVVRSPDLLKEPPDSGPGFYLWRDPGDRLAAEPVDLSDEAKEHLRSLGYLH
ncbi:MAG: sulfatase [Candidatus Eisenbacteria sp.]|nr:sulfatase [Candidatus Eisenbacteria bacterium]